VGWYVLTLSASFALILVLVVVKTGDHTLIGKWNVPLLLLSIIHHSLGQIAALTGGETGNKSPLAVEMYVALSETLYSCSPLVYSTVVVLS